MLEFCKGDESLKETLKVEDDENDLYTLRLDGELIGYGILNKDKDKTSNVIWIEIMDKYRGNGYGKALFAKLVEEAKKLGYQRLFLDFPKDNVILKKLVMDYNGIFIANENGISKYVVPISN